LARISLNVIVFNEEARLEDCLLDARDFVDEIVVVDQMSTDGTPDIAQRLADVYIRDVHHGHAEPSRELAASSSSGDWILILDADEKMSDLFKAELPKLVDGDVDGYWVRKLNVVGGEEASTVLHYRLVRKSRVRFDPSPHGGATALSDNIDVFDQIGIFHEKSVAEQLYDDARYEQMALEDLAPTSSKRNWLQHNQTLRQQRELDRRRDLEALVPPDAARVLVLGDLALELPDCTVIRINPGDLDGADATADPGPGFDAVVCALNGDGTMAELRTAARLVRPGGTLIGTAPAVRNRRGIEETIGTILFDGPPSDLGSGGGTTRPALLAELPELGFDPRWMRLVRDGWLDHLAVRPDGRGTVVESEEFLLKRVPADVSEELTAKEIVFAAIRQDSEVPTCSIVVVAVVGEDPRNFAGLMLDTASEYDYELVVVQSRPGSTPIVGATSVLVAEGASLATRWNAGARAASGQLLAFVSAAAVPHPGWLDALVQTHRSRPDTGAVGSKIITSDGSIEHAGLVIGSDGAPFRIYQGDGADQPHVNRPRIMPAVAAEGMITARTRFVAVGGFDEALGDDLTDADLCLRLRSRGLPILYAPAAILSSAVHAVPGSAGSFRRSAREFVARWSPTTLGSDDLICRIDRRDVGVQTVRSWRLPRPTGPGPGPGTLPAIAWSSHFLESGGYTEEAVAAVEALDDAGLHVVANPVSWDRRGTPMPARKAERLAALMDRDLPDDFVHVAHIGANRFKLHPAARRNVGRTMFETDGLPAEWRDRCNAMDEIWVPSDHNLTAFANAGVAASKLHKVPETFDRELFHPDVTPLEIGTASGGFVFLSMFSWGVRKGWDILLRAWFEEFDKQDDVTLLFKTDTINAFGVDCRHEVDSFIRDHLGRDPRKGPRVVVLDRHLDAADVPRLYRAADAFVLASHGEGWGRPYMEAMAMELPTIGTRWSGNLEFMDDDNSYLIGSKLVDTPTDSWLQGQRWAQPSRKELRRAMRRVYEHRDEATKIGQRARSDVLISCAPELVVDAVRARLESIDRHPVHVGVPDGTPLNPRKRPSAERRAPKKGTRVSACVVVQDEIRSESLCVSSLEGVADTLTVVHANTDDDMASVRNEALENATGDWVLMLDGTHTLDPESIDTVRDLVAGGQFCGYTARVLRQFSLDGAVSAVVQRTATLFPRHRGLRYVGRVDEQLLPRGAELKFRVAPSPIVLYQHEYRGERLDPVARARQHLPLLERSVREEPGEPFHLYNLGCALTRLGLHDESETNLRRATKLADDGSIWLPSAYVALSQTVAAQGRRIEAAKLCKRATKLTPQWAYGWCMLGAAQVDIGRFDLALRAYERALSCVGSGAYETGDNDDTSWLVRAGLGKIHLSREEYDEAAECLRDAATFNPRNSDLHLLLARAYEGLGRSGDAMEHFDRAATIDRLGADTYVTLADLFTGKAERALLIGLADNAESRVLLQRIERLRAAT
jgi:glycosyltransferase involved in cell wall biosynthesis/tetratricopeptide (TPR) repeat protein